MRVIVQKFGGLLLGSRQGRRQVADRIIESTADGTRVVAVASAIGREGDPYATDTLMTLLRDAADAAGDADPRTLDLLLSTGEVISTALMAHVLVQSGCRAVALTGAQAGILTTDEFNDARILSIDPTIIHRYLDPGNVVVVAGFQGVTGDGEITTLGRGGSDTTAVAIGAALEAELVEIYKDVEGIMTADPKFVSGARPIRAITYDEVSQMAALGARVLHPRAADIGREHGVRLVIKRLGSSGGTVIARGPELGVPIIDGRPVIGLAHLPDVIQVKIARVPGEDLERPLAALRSLAEQGISIDLISLLPEMLAFTVQQDVVERAANLLATLGFAVTLSEPCAKVSIIGAGMRGRPGVMARVVNALHGAGVEILQTADSHTTISCLVPRPQMAAALAALHDEFGLAEEVASERESEG
jgi:aspartate kinase